MSLRDGTKKMSKSDPSDYSRIHLLDDNETIDLKIRKSKTDADVIHGSVEGLEQRPEAKNLLNLYALFTNSSLAKVVQEFEGKPFSEFKPKLTEATINHLAPIRSAMIELLADEAALLDYLQKGAEAANNIAGANIKEVRHALNMV